MGKIWAKKVHATRTQGFVVFLWASSVNRKAFEQDSYRVSRRRKNVERPIADFRTIQIGKAKRGSF
jgi:hypothetical protein